MASQKTRTNFLETEEGRDIRAKFQQLADDSQYNTPSSYSANSALYPDNMMPFVEKHLDYLTKHPSVEADKYLSNLKLITRLR